MTRPSLPALAAALLLASCAPSDPMPEGPGAAASVRPAGSSAGYVGPEACASCHGEIAARFARTGMGRSLDRVTPQTGHRLARFPDALDVPHQGLRYAMSERDGTFYVKQHRTGPGGRVDNADERALTYVLGSGNHSRSFVTSHEGRLYQVPVCWYPQADRWDLCPGYEVSNPGFQRGIDDTCLACHNGRVDTDGRFSNRFLEPFAHGIDCERCHGPGERHVEAWRSGRGDTPDEQGGSATIVNPARLPADRGIQVCMQCHLGDSAQSERVHLRPDRMQGWRPGQRLQETVAIFTFREQLPGHFGLAAQADRLALSRCYTASAGRLQCITCHDPHDEVYDVSRRDPGHFNAACSECHAGSPGRAGEHARQGGDCVACHMRRAQPHDHPHTTFLDHWIRRRPEEGAHARRTDFTLRPFFDGHESEGTQAGRALALGRAYLNKKTGTVEGRSMPWDLPVSALEQAVQADPGSAPAHFFLGKAEMGRGRPESAQEHFRRAVALDPDHVEAQQNLGSALLALGRLDEAAAALERALAIGPRGDDEGAVLNELARVEMQRGRLDAAGGRLRAALQVEPLGPEIHANLGLLASLKGDMEGAVASYRRALELSPNEPAVRRYLAEALAAPGPQNDAAGAIFEARLAARLAPRHPGGWALLGRVCAAAGDAACEREARRGAARAAGGR
jgi:tetratricopeptide (TPR) repeat protein